MTEFESEWWAKRAPQLIKAVVDEYEWGKCPECGSPNICPTGTPDEDGLVEYRCLDCGHYFVDDAA